MKTLKIKKLLSLVLTAALLLTVCVTAPLTASAATVSVTTNNSGTVTTVDATVGQELPRPDGISGLTFIGWYSDLACTVPYGEVLSNETRIAYAKYDKTLITFEQKTDYVAGTDYRDDRNSSTSTSGVVVDPTDSTNHVFKLHSPDIYANVQMPIYEAQNAPYYELESNHSYTFTFHFMIPDTIPTSTFTIRCNKGNAPTGGTGRTSFGDKAYTTADITPGVWYEYSTTYNVGDTSLQTGIQAVFCVADSTYDTNYVYFDNMIIKDNDADYQIPIDNTYTGFENAVVTYDGGFNSSTSATISETQAKAGSKSLKIAPTGSNTYRAYVYNGEKTAIRLEPDTNYEVSYWYYAESASSNTIYIERVNAGSVWGGNYTVHTQYVDAAETGKWIKVSFKFNSGNCASYPYLNFALSGNAGDVFYFDEFTITATGKELVDYSCDFDADFSFYNEPNAEGNWKYYCSGAVGSVPWTQDNGVVSFTTSHTTTPSTTSAVWVQHFAPYNGSFFSFESNSVYEIKVRYKQTLTSSSATGYFSVGLKTNPNGSQAIKSLVINNETGTTDWIEKTFTVTTGTLTDKVMTITMGVSSGTATFDLDYIKVTKGPFINDSGEISRLTASAGTEIPEPAAKDGLQFLGWFSDVSCTVPYGKVTENETRNAYAKYDKTLITFGQCLLTSGSNYRDDAATHKTFTSGITTDPTDSLNNVFKQHNPGIWANMVIPVYDAAGATPYELANGNEYTVSIDYMIPETATASYITIRMMGGTGSTGGTRSPYGSTQKQLDVSTLTKGKWYTYTATFTASNVSSAPYLMYAFLMDDNSNTGDDVSEPATFGAENFLYIDNITVYNASEFVDVKLNNRGYTYTENVMIGQYLPDLRSVDEANFQGWYSDPECTVPFGAVQANDTHTAYAKYDTVKISFIADTAVPGLVQLSNAYALKFDATSIETRFNIPCYDAVGASNLTVEANKTYAVRFIYKLGANSDAGYISVLGNKFKFKATEAGTDGWAVAAITFNTAESGELTFNLASNSAATVYVDEFTVYEVSAAAPETEVLSGSSTISATAPTASNNMLTGKVTVNLASGEQLRVRGLYITYDLYATAFSEEITTQIFINSGSYDLDRDDIPGNGNEFVYMAPANAKNIKISAEFVAADTTNMAIIASSIREKSEQNSAGIRFRGRVYNMDGIKKVGFLLAPKNLIDAAGAVALTLENAEACQALNADVTNVIYDQTDTYTDYQVLLTGLNAMTSLDITVTLYVEYDDGSVEYTSSATQSYDNFVAVSEEEIRGITSYYYDEFEDTRDKLISKSEDGSFSAIMLSDTHIDYGFNTASSDISEFYTSSYYTERAMIERTVAAVIEMANTSDVDCIVLGGDLIHGTSSYASSLADLHFFADMFSKSKVPVYVNKGNHDNNDYHGTPCALQHIISTDTWTEELLKPLARNTEVHDENNLNSAYYYVDFPEKETRMIVLSPYSFPITSTDGVNCDWTAELWNRIEDTQLEWFSNVALDTEKQGWNYVISCHSPIYGGDTFSNVASIQAIIEAFNSKTTVDVAGSTVDFSNAGSYIPYSISGHTHVQSWRLSNSGTHHHVAVNTTSGRLANYPSYNYSDSDTKKEYKIDRYEGDISEAAFDAIVVSRDADVIDRFSFGAGYDHEFTLGDSGYTAAEIN